MGRKTPVRCISCRHKGAIKISVEYWHEYSDWSGKMHGHIYYDKVWRCIHCKGLYKKSLKMTARVEEL